MTCGGKGRTRVVWVRSGGRGAAVREASRGLDLGALSGYKVDINI